MQPDGPATESPGLLIGDRYRLETRIGSGGMSTVHRAVDEKLHRPVAVKLMHRSTAADEGQLKRFRREARAVAGLSHPNLVGVIDAGDDDGRPYIVFEYIAGETLKTRIRRNGRLELDESVAFAIEVAWALGAAHDAGIIHRDVKPQNVLVDGEGRARVTDFGIARTMDEEGLTADGRVIGTTDYVSPEQAMGQDVGPQSDIYSLGIVLFEMLTGRVPFSADSPVAVAMCHVRDPMPDVRAARPEVSATLAAVVDRATAKSPADRHQSVDELVADLESALTIETARSGGAGETATSVIRTLPEEERRRVPIWVRSRGSRIALAVSAVAVIGVGAAIAVNGIHRGTGVRGATPSGLSQVPLSDSAAVPYDPFGDGSEHEAESRRMLDGVGSTAWTSETYYSGLQKAGVGVALDAKPGVTAKAVGIRTATPGFTVSIWGANGDLPESRVAGSGPAGGTPPSRPPEGWARLSPDRQADRATTVRLTPPLARHRWYLIWVNRLAPDQRTIEISEATLLR